MTTPRKTLRAHAYEALEDLNRPVETLMDGADRLAAAVAELA